MQPRSVQSLLIALCLLASALAPGVAAPVPSAEDVRVSVGRALPFVERAGLGWMEQKGCVSCHNVAFLLWTHTEAQRRGFPVDAAKIASWTDWALGDTLKRGKDGAGPDTIAQLILARDPAARRPANPPDAYEALQRNMLAAQRADGSWSPGGQLTSPAEVTTGWGVLALAARETSNTRAESAQSRDRALAWLKQVSPAPSTEALLLRFLVQRRIGDPEAAGAALRQLRERQRPDGGWSYRDQGAVSDAFAIGQVLYALGRGGVAASDPAVQQGIAYLLATQLPDGSWKTPTRSIHDAEDPRVVKTDPIYHYWGTTWAVLGLLQTLSEAQQ
jgi:Squalene-hopene cyclase C-terminal domain